MLDDEVRLIYGLRTGDEQAQVALFDRYGELLRRFLIHMCRVDDADAQDLAVETMYRAVRRISQFQIRPNTGPNVFRNWLFTIARNLWRDQLRRQKRTVHLDDWERINDAGAGDEDIVVPQEIEALRQALEKLPDKQRQTLALFYSGSTLTEVAAILDAPVGTVRQWKSRAIAFLASQLTHHAAFAHMLPEGQEDE